MSGGVLVWLTDNELKLLTYLLFSDDPPVGSDEAKLYRKLEAMREEVSCRVGRA